MVPTINLIGGGREKVHGSSRGDRSFGKEWRLDLHLGKGRDEQKAFQDG